ncbi:hypothetical protein [Bdellovibrio sp. HCB2-146]|uniref:hypothetical protein n=1 Tax=Bdellovibrio sp. HCB2-146 TaxID=3394362 RepID=UPI0039BC74DE
MFLLFTVSMIGYAFVHRIYREIIAEFALSDQSMHVLCIYLIVVGVFAATFHASPLSLWIFIGILLISLKFFPTILRFFLLRRLRSALIPLLDGIILGVQAGKSFRSALHSSIELQRGWVRNQLRELQSLLLSSEQEHALKSALLKDFMAELVEIDRSQSRCADQLRALRGHLKIQEDFRRRSGQLTQQIKMQAIIVTLLFLGLLSFVIAQFGWHAHQKLIMGSVILFLAGLFWIFNAGRRMKWKV